MTTRPDGPASLHAAEQKIRQSEAVADLFERQLGELRGLLGELRVEIDRMKQHGR